MTMQPTMKQSRTKVVWDSGVKTAAADGGIPSDSVADDKKTCCMLFIFAFYLLPGWLSGQDG